MHWKRYRIYRMFPGLFCSWAQVEYFSQETLIKNAQIIVSSCFTIFYRNMLKEGRGNPSVLREKMQEHAIFTLQKILLFRLSFQFSEISVLLNFQFCLLFVFHLLFLLAKHLVIFFKLFCLVAVIILDIYIIFHSQSSTLIYYEYGNT